MHATHRFKTGAATIAAMFLIASCGGGGGGGVTAGGGAVGGGAGGASTGVSGNANKGIVINGIVTLKDGQGNVLTTTPSQVLTGNDGSFTADVGDYSGPVFVEVMAGPNTTIQDEVTGANEPASGVAGVLLESVTTVTAGQSATAHVTPFTSVVAQLAKNSAGMNTPVSTVLVQQAQAAIASTLGFEPTVTKPLNPRDAAATAAGIASLEERKQAVLLAALAEFGNTSPACDGVGTRATELACAARQYSMAFRNSSISNGAATVTVDGSALDGFTMAVQTVSADSAINATGTTIEPASDPATTKLATAEQNPQTPQTEMVMVPAEGFNANDVAAVRTLFNNLRSNAAALDNAQFNGPIETQLTAFANSINVQTFGLDFGTLEILDATAQAGGLFVSYATSAEPRPTTSLVGGPGIVGTTGCQVFAGIPGTDENGVVRSVPPTASASGMRNGQSVGCTIFGPAIASPGGFSQIRHYTLYTLAGGTTDTLVVNSDSRLCTFPAGYNIATDPDTCLANGQVFGGVAGNETRARMSTASDGSLNIFFNGAVAPPLDFAFSESGPGGVLLADSVSVDIDFTANDSVQNGFFRGNGSITSVKAENTLTASFTDIDFTGNEALDGTLTGIARATGTVESDAGILTGSFSANSATAGTGSVRFDGSLAVGSVQNRIPLFTGSLVLTENMGSSNTPRTDTATFSGRITLPQRPILDLDLQLSEVFGSNGMTTSETVAFTYQQNGTTVIFSGEATATGELVTFNSPTSMVTVGPFNPDTASVVDVLRQGRKAAEYRVQDARINYVDGSFEQF